MPTMNMIQALNSAMDVMLDARSRRPRLRRGRRLFRRRLPRHRGPAEEIRRRPAASTRRSPKAASSASPSAWAPMACGRWWRSSSPTTSIPAYDQIVSEAARLRYRSAGDFTAPITIRTPYGGGIFGGQTHSQSPEALFTHVAGLKTVIPSNPYDAKGLLISRDRGRRSGASSSSRSGSTTARSTAITTGRCSPGRSIPASEVPRRALHRPARQAAVVRAGDGGHGAGLRHHGARGAGRGRGEPASTPR